jgi:hypothetical protein
MHCIVVVHLYGLMAEHCFLEIFTRLLTYIIFVYLQGTSGLTLYKRL